MNKYMPIVIISLVTSLLFLFVFSCSGTINNTQNAFSSSSNSSSDSNMVNTTITNYYTDGSSNYSIINSTNVIITNYIWLSNYDSTNSGLITNWNTSNRLICCVWNNITNIFTNSILIFNNVHNYYFTNAQTNIYFIYSYIYSNVIVISSTNTPITNLINAYSFNTYTILNSTNWIESNWVSSNYIITNSCQFISNYYTNGILLDFDIHNIYLSNYFTSTNCTSISNYISIIPKPDKIMAEWLFLGNANDLSSNSNHGTIHGVKLTNNRFGHPNQAYWFDGFDDYIDCSFDSSIDPSVSNTFSVSVWINCDYLDPNQTIIGEWPLAFLLYVSTSNLIWNVNNRSQPNYQLSMLLNTWNHIVGTYDGSNTCLYVNGILVDQDIGILLTNQGTTLLIGNNFTANSYFNGIIDDIRLYNCVLNSNDVKILFNETY